MPQSPLLLVLLPLLFPLRSADDEARLAEARGQLEQRQEQQVNAGADACVAMNSPASVALLLDVLARTSSPSGHLAPGHYRDIAWDRLTRITDLYARKRVEQELRESEDPRVRQWCAELLGLYGDDDFGAALTDALDDREACVQRAAARALGRIAYSPAARQLEKRVRERDPYVRANAIEALARIDPAEHAERFRKGLSDKDGGVRCALLGAAAEIYPDEVEAWSVAAREKDEDWRPRIQAVENLGGVRTKTAVDALLASVDDGRPVVGMRAIDALQGLTGQSFTRKDQWERWWGDHRETFAFPEGRQAVSGAGKDRSVAVYNGIDLVSDHVAFLIDKSEAMSERLVSRGSSKDEAAASELEQALEALEGRLEFNVHCYELRTYPFQERGAVAASKKARRNALEFVRDRRLQGSKDIWNALEAVLADPELDTAYLLSSGEPDTGLYVHWNRVVFQLEDMNRFHKVVVHGIAYSDNDWYSEQIQKIAECTGGDFQRFQ